MLVAENEIALSSQHIFLKGFFPRMRENLEVIYFPSHFPRYEKETGV